MRKRLAAVGLGLVIGANAGAQPPQFPASPPRTQPPASPQYPQFPGAPFPQMPPMGAQPSPLVPGQNTPPVQKPAPVGDVPLPYPEQKVPMSALDVQVKRVVGGWQVWAGQRMVRDLGDSENTARDLARVLRDQRATEWVGIGLGPRPVVEYGLVNGRPVATLMPSDPKADPNAGQSGVVQAGGNGPAATGAGAKVVLPIDLRTARLEPIRGVWCVRDDDTLLFNFGADKANAEQALAVIRKYGFNRVGLVGDAKQPAMSYLYVSNEAERPKVAGGQLLMNAQIDALTRTGIPIPGVGYTGEMVKIDAKKVEARKDGAEWVVAAGPEVLGRFGPTEWAAREAARAVQDGRFTEYCKLGGTSGMTFFLRDGKAPTRAPFNAQGRNFDPMGLKVQQVNDRWAVTDAGKPLVEVASAAEGEVVVRVIRAYGFDQFAHLSAGGAKGGVTYLVKNR